MSRPLFSDDIGRAEDVIRALGPNVTVALGPTAVFMSGEVWTIQKVAGEQIDIGQGGTLFAAYEDLCAGEVRP